MLFCRFVLWNFCFLRRLAIVLVVNVNLPALVPRYPIDSDVQPEASLAVACTW